jgi:hypothetical protein
MDGFFQHLNPLYPLPIQIHPSLQFPPKSIHPSSRLSHTTGADSTLAKALNLGDKAPNPWRPLAAFPVFEPMERRERPRRWGRRKKRQKWREKGKQSVSQEWAFERWKDRHPSFPSCCFLRRCLAAAHLAPLAKATCSRLPAAAAILVHPSAPRPQHFPAPALGPGPIDGCWPRGRLLHVFFCLAKSLLSPSRSRPFSTASSPSGQEWGSEDSRPFSQSVTPLSLAASAFPPSSQWHSPFFFVLVAKLLFSHFSFPRIRSFLLLCSFVLLPQHFLLFLLPKRITFRETQAKDN